MVRVSFIPCASSAFRLVVFLGCFLACIGFALSTNIKCKKCDDTDDCQNPSDDECGSKDDYFCGSTWIDNKAQSMSCVKRDDKGWDHVSAGKCAHSKLVQKSVNSQWCGCDNEDFCNTKMPEGAGNGGGGGSKGSSGGGSKGSDGSINKSTTWTYLLLLIVSTNSYVLFKRM